jgi:hypothetical protein
MVLQGLAAILLEEMAASAIEIVAFASGFYALVAGHTFLKVLLGSLLAACPRRKGSHEQQDELRCKEHSPLKAAGAGMSRLGGETRACMENGFRPP